MPTPTDSEAAALAAVYSLLLKASKRRLERLAAQVRDAGQAASASDDAPEIEPHPQNMTPKE